MTHPVITIEADHLDRAWQIMLDHHIRHLPVVLTLPNGTRRLIGILSMRDIVKWKFTRPPEALPTAPDAPRLIPTYIDTEDGDFFIAFRSLLERLRRDLEVRPLNAGDNPEKALRIVDASKLTMKQIVERVRDGLRVSPESRYLIVYDPKRYPPQATERLQKLKETGRIDLFQMPINLVAASALLGDLKL
jgi:hypothetical protein